MSKNSQEGLARRDLSPSRCSLSRREFISIRIEEIMKRLILIIGLILTFNPPSIAQSKTEPQNKPQTEQAKDDDAAAIHLKTNLVNLNIKVTDLTNRPIVDLKKEDFVILEDGVQQDVTFFQPITAPITLVLLLDFSGSTEDKRKVLFNAAKKFIEALNRT